MKAAAKQAPRDGLKREELLTAVARHNIDPLMLNGVSKELVETIDFSSYTGEQMRELAGRMDSWGAQLRRAADERETQVN